MVHVIGPERTKPGMFEKLKKGSVAGATVVERRFECLDLDLERYCRNQIIQGMLRSPPPPNRVGE